MHPWTYAGFYVSYRNAEGIDVEDLEQWRPSSIPGHASTLGPLHISLYTLTAANIDALTRLALLSFL